MLKTFQWSGSIGVMMIVISFLSIQAVLADEPCGNIITNNNSHPITNCTNPFNGTEEAPVEVKLNGVSVVPNTNVTIQNGAWSVFETASPQFSISLYKKEGNDYIFWHHIPDTSIRQYRDQSIEIKKILENEYYYNVLGQDANWSEYARNPDLPLGDNYHYVYDFEHDYAPYASMLTTGNYTLVLASSGGDPVGPQLSRTDKIKNFLIPTAHAQGFPGAPSEVFTIPFTVNGGDVITVPEPVVDPLILQYTPILYFHEDEDYFPMDVESFVGASALWSTSGIDTQLYSSTSLTFDVFEDFIQDTDDTLNYYLAFSSPDTKKTIDLEKAHMVYNNLRKTDTYATTTYYRVMTDTTDDGREFVVLQYWYFYAMNNWGEKVGGFANNHEGDWESVFVFLDNSNPTNLYPKYIAYSAHLNDGENEVYNPFQYDSVRRVWNSDDVVKDNGRIVSFVAQGSHANYPSNNGGEYKVRRSIDKTSDNEPPFVINTYKDIAINNVIWSQYEGKWGTDSLLSPGGNGPQGPLFIDVTGQLRFNNPIQWAGINRIQEQVIIDPVTTVPFNNSNVLLEFTEPVSNTSISVTPYYEPITFGIVPDSATMLPGYYNFITSMDNGTFEVNMTLPYDAQYVESLGESPENIRFGFYNELTDTWEMLPAVLDEQNHSVSTMRTGFSRYALMLIESEEDSATEEFETETLKKNTQGTRIRKLEAQVLGVSISTIPIDDLQKLLDATEVLVGQYSSMDAEQKKVLLSILKEIAEIEITSILL